MTSGRNGYPVRRDAWDSLDASLPDHFPTCPHCGNLCGRLARICVDCGSKLYLESDDSAFRREAVPPTEGQEL